MYAPTLSALITIAIRHMIPAIRGFMPALERRLSMASRSERQLVEPRRAHDGTSFRTLGGKLQVVRNPDPF